MAKTVAMVFGWIFLVLGVLGFVSNPLVGEAAWLEADMAHNVVHLVSGALLLWAAYGAPGRASAMLRVFGVVYLVVAVLGFVTGEGEVLGFISSNMADHWLHLVLAAVFLWAGWKKEGEMGAPSQPMQTM